MHLKDKHILLAITGSIAAYKAAELIRMLRAGGAQVKVVMTHDACAFITELTIQALCGAPVYKDLLDPDTENRMSHISLAKWADLVLVAPATANTMAKFATGICDDLLSTLYLATKAPVMLAPAMNQQMWQHPAVVANKLLLEQHGVIILGPDVGEQACGDVGPGRMLEPDKIREVLSNFFAPRLFRGIKIMISAGPTREPLDPIRYISNYSSGKMGYALAEVAAEFGADTLLISGPTSLAVPTGASRINIETAEEMQQAILAKITAYDIFISCAAVADYRCQNKAAKKIKKDNLPVIEWEKNVDILTEISKLSPRPFLVGFAAESENLIENATAKLQAKNLDMIIGNLIGTKDAGINSDFNEVTVLTPKSQLHFQLATKKQLAYKLMPLILSAYQKKPI